MDVSSIIFQPIFEGVKQYAVPLFQRSYSWNCMILKIQGNIL